MHKLFKKQQIVLYPERLEGFQFDTVEVFPMRFEDQKKSVLEKAYQAESNQTPDFYSVFVAGENGRYCIADCATIELATQIEQLMEATYYNYSKI